MSIKINKAKKIVFNILPQAKKEIFDTIESYPYLKEKLTGKELSVLAMALNTHWKKACEWKEKDIIAQGCLWDESKQSLIEFG